MRKRLNSKKRNLDENNNLSMHEKKMSPSIPDGHSRRSKSIANDLRNIGIRRIDDLKGMDPGRLYELSNEYAGTIQDRCLLYVFRCAVYFAETLEQIQDPEKLKWWYWRDRK